jgi:hypothetical protein
MAAAFFLGVIVGVIGMCIVAMRLATNKPQDKPQHGVATTSVSLSGYSDTRIDAHSARQLADVLRNYEGTRQ